MVKTQPAKKGYFFGQSYKDTGKVFKETFGQIKESLAEQKEHMSDASYNAGKSKIFRWIFRIIVCIFLCIFGGLMALSITVAHTLLNVVLMLLYYLLFLAVLLIDRAYLALKKISISCRECKAKFMYPTYECPDCGERHDHLTPSIYGAFRRTCNCGRKLPTSVFGIKEKRSDLDAFCPKCLEVGRETQLLDRASRPICIPVVGGPSVGKSAFITAYANILIDSIAVDNNVEIEYYDADVGNDFNTKREYYKKGQIVKTAVQTDVTRASSIAFSFFAKHKRLNPDRLIHIYDIAGESFIGGANEIQKQYDYCNGIILIIDPFAIPEVMARYGQELNSTDKSGTSETEVDSMMENFVRTLENTTGLSKRTILRTPLAVVFNKKDEANLDDIIGDAAVREKMSEQPEIFTDFFDTMDHLCREFLKEVDMNDVMTHIYQSFKNTRFFAVSSMGHTQGEGEYEPQNVVPVLDWIIGNSDKKLASIISPTKFSGKKLPIDYSVQVIDLDSPDAETAKNDEEVSE